MGNCTKAPEVPEYPYTAAVNNGHAGTPSLMLPQGVGMIHAPSSNVENFPPSNIPPTSYLPMGYPTLSVGPASHMKQQQQNVNDLRAANFMANALAPVNTGNLMIAQANVPRPDGMHTTGAPWKAGVASPAMQPS